MEKEQLISLVCAVQQGKEDAATNLYNAFHQDLYYHISKTVNDPALAEDLLQDTFFEIFKTIDQLNEPAAFVTWSKQIAYHRCTAYFRKRREILADEDEDGYSIFDTIEEDRAEFIPDEALDKEDLKQTIHAMIAQLPPEQRSALLMRYFDELSVKKIAEIQGVSEGTVKSRLNYGRKAIQKSVEDYEKKNNVKLHCAGVIPLLLWLFREYAIANKISLTATTASASYVAAATPTTYAAANAAAPIVAEGAKAGAKAAGKFAVKKLIAGIAAAAVVTGGVAVGLSSQTPQDSTPGTSTSTEATSTSAPNTDQTETPASTPDIRPEKEMRWYGYGNTSMANSGGTRFDLEISVMDDSKIQGRLTRSNTYNVAHQTEFTGMGEKRGDKIEYTLHFATPAVLGSVVTVEHNEILLTYDITNDCFVMDDFYTATMAHISTKSNVLIAESGTWTGYGTDSFYNVLKKENHLFELDIFYLTESEISGHLTVSYNEQIDHASNFTGRGYRVDEMLYYEILLETPRTQNNIIEITVSTFWLAYDCTAESFEILLSNMYGATMLPEK